MKRLLLCLAVFAAAISMADVDEDIHARAWHGNEFGLGLVFHADRPSSVTEREFRAWFEDQVEEEDLEILSQEDSRRENMRGRPIYMLETYYDKPSIYKDVGTVVCLVSLMEFLPLPDVEDKELVKTDCFAVCLPLKPGDEEEVYERVAQLAAVAVAAYQPEKTRADLAKMKDLQAHVRRAF